MPYPFDIEANKNSLEERRVACLVSYLHPFRIINTPNSPDWDVTIDEVNSHTWDYVALHELVGGVDVGLESPYHMTVCRDGGVAIPPITNLRSDQSAVAFFNKCFASLLLGGVYCEAIGRDGLQLGWVLDWKYVRTCSPAIAVSNRFHEQIRSQRASPLESIALVEPRSISFEEFSEAISTGQALLEKIPELSSDFLLMGVTSFARRDWGSALSNLWIVVEQLTSHFWKKVILDSAKITKDFPGRIDQLSDNRTWTSSAKHELLFQLETFSAKAFKNLAVARKARNSLVHDGKRPSEEAATAVIFAVKELIRNAAPDIPIPFLKLDLKNHSLSDPFGPIKSEPIEPKYWMEIKKLPGEAEIEQLAHEKSTENG